MHSVRFWKLQQHFFNVAYNRGLIANSGVMVWGLNWRGEGLVWGHEKRDRARGGLNLQARKRNDIPPNMTHGATSRQIKHSGVGCAVWQPVTVAASSEGLKTGALSFTWSKGLSAVWFNFIPSAPRLLHYWAYLSVFYLASTSQRTVMKCFTKEEMNTINNNSNKKLCKHSKERWKKTTRDQEKWIKAHYIRATL